MSINICIIISMLLYYTILTRFMFRVATAGSHICDIVTRHICQNNNVTMVGSYVFDIMTRLRCQNNNVITVKSHVNLCIMT